MPDGKLSPISDLRKRILEISYKHKLSHIGSCLTMLTILYDIYQSKKDEDIVILSAGHAGLAQFVILEDLLGHDAEELLNTQGIHPCRDLEKGIYVSAGSLGLAITIALGMAIGNPEKTVYCASSDGELAEGSWWEAVRFANNNKIKNFKVVVNVNGYSAFGEIDSDRLDDELSYYWPMVEVIHTDSDMPFAHGLAAHYQVMTDNDYENMVNDNA